MARRFGHWFERLSTGLYGIANSQANQPHILVGLYCQFYINRDILKWRPPRLPPRLVPVNPPRTRIPELGGTSCLACSRKRYIDCSESYSTNFVRASIQRAMEAKCYFRSEPRTQRIHRALGMHVCRPVPRFTRTVLFRVSPRRYLADTISCYSTGRSRF